MDKLIGFVNRLKKVGIYHTLSNNDDYSVSVLVVVPGQYWDVQFHLDGEVGIEKFKSDGVIHPESELDVLFRDFSE